MIDIEAGYLSVVIIIKAVKTLAKPISKGCFELRDLNNYLVPWHHLLYMPKMQHCFDWLKTT